MKSETSLKSFRVKSEYIILENSLQVEKLTIFKLFLEKGCFCNLFFFFFYDLSVQSFVMASRRILRMIFFETILQLPLLNFLPSHLSSRWRRRWLSGENRLFEIFVKGGFPSAFQKRGRIWANIHSSEQSVATAKGTAWARRCSRAQSLRQKGEGTGRRNRGSWTSRDGPTSALVGCCPGKSQANNSSAPISTS